jgi:solute carrier family 25 phosphate transporter 3
MATKSQELPTFTASDYLKFFGAGALAATSTHAVSIRQRYFN